MQIVFRILTGLLFISVASLLGAPLTSKAVAQSQFSAKPENTQTSAITTAPANNNFTAGFSVSNDTVDFLPVDEAYKAQLKLNGDDLVIDWEIASGYYLYKNKFKFAEQKKDATSKLDTLYEQGRMIYDVVFEKDLEVFYHNSRTLSSLKQADNNSRSISVEFQGCADAGLCYPPQTLWYTINTDTQTIKLEDQPQPSTSAIQTTNIAEFFTAVLLAMLGGLILNLMPCVFPVLSIKALSLAEAHQSNHEKHRHGWSYTIGVVLSFITIASIMLILKASGQAIGWGFQLQSPIFISILVYVFFAMGLSLMGATEFGTRFMGIGQNLTLQAGYRGSFFTGALAAVVASPCTAPFMGTALGFALGLPPLLALSIFAALGFGMALPFLLLSYFPKLGDKLPKPGPWMETFKQILAFPLFLAAIWLSWVLGRQSGSDALALILLGLTLISFSIWLSRFQHIASKLLAIASLIMALLLPLLMNQLSIQSKPSHSNFWQPYSEETLQQALNEGRSVFVNATAAWCLTCLANEKLAFTDAFEEQLIKNNTLALKADWTNYDPAITKLLRKHNRDGVPLYVFYQDGGATLLPQLLIESTVLKALQPQPSKKP